MGGFCGDRILQTRDWAHNNCGATDVAGRCPLNLCEGEVMEEWGDFVDGGIFLRQGEIFTEDRFSGNAHLQCRLSGALFWIFDRRIRYIWDQTVWLVVGGVWHEGSSMHHCVWRCVLATR